MLTGLHLGWTSPDGREFVAVGQTDGTAFVEVKRNGRLEYKGRLPTQTEPIVWRDMKVIDGYVYIGSEAPGHGLQVFDMRKVCDREFLLGRYCSFLANISHSC